MVKVDRRIRWHYTTTILRLRIGARLTRYRNCKFDNFAGTISRYADGISRYSVPPSAGPLLPLIDITLLRNRIPKIMYFPDRECVRSLRQLYGYAIGTADVAGSWRHWASARRPLCRSTTDGLCVTQVEAELPSQPAFIDTKCRRRGPHQPHRRPYIPPPRSSPPKFEL